MRESCRRITLIGLCLCAGIALAVPVDAEPRAFLQCQTSRTYSSSPREVRGYQGICNAFPSINLNECPRVILEDLKSRDPLLAQGPSRIVILEHEQANAYLLDMERIGITRVLLEKAVDRDQLRFVLAHELGHFILNRETTAQLHQRGLPTHFLETQELQADQYASWLLAQKQATEDNYLRLLDNFDAQSAFQSTPQTARLAVRAKNLRQFRY